MLLRFDCCWGIPFRSVRLTNIKRNYLSCSLRYTVRIEPVGSKIYYWHQHVPNLFLCYKEKLFFLYFIKTINLISSLSISYGFLAFQWVFNWIIIRYEKIVMDVCLLGVIQEKEYFVLNNNTIILDNYIKV